MRLINIYDAVRAVDRHMLEDGTLDNDISCILEEVTPVMIPQKASSSCSHENDTISRQAVIDLLKQMRKDGDMVPWEGKDVFARIRKLPSAQPEPPEECERCMMEHTDEMEKLEAELAMAQPKRGKWERHYSRQNVYADLCWHCSECGYRSSDNWADKFNFCPNCGADMRQREE